MLAAYSIATYQLALSSAQAVTVSFLTLAFAQLWHVFNMRAPGAGRFVNDVTKNVFVWGALVLCIGITLVAVYVPPIAAAINVVPPGPQGWMLAMAASLLPAVVGLLRP